MHLFYLEMKCLNKCSREISIIIGKIWNQMTEQSKLPYQLKANEIKRKKNQMITFKYNNF